jgi:hypothetical protein
MSNNNMTDLREVMFKTIEELKAGTLDISQAEAVASLGQVIVNSRKVEVDFTKAVGGKNLKLVRNPNDEDDLSHRFPSRVNHQLAG